MQKSNHKAFYRIATLEHTDSSQTSYRLLSVLNSYVLSMKEVLYFYNRNIQIFMFNNNMKFKDNIIKN